VSEEDIKQKPPIWQRVAKKCVSKHALKLAFEALAILLVFILLFIGALLWKLKSSPIDISFIKPAIMQAVNSEDSQYQADFQYIVIAWPKLEGALKLRALDMRVKSKNKDVFSVEQADLFFDVKALLKGKIAIDEVILYGPKAHILRDENNNFTIDIATHKKPPSIQPNAQDDPDTSFASDLIEMLAQTEQEAIAADSNLGYLDRLEIKDAQIIVSDMRSHMTWFLPQVDAALNRWEKGVSARLDISLSPQSRLEENQLNAELNYERNSEQIEAKLNITNFDVSILSRYIKELAPLRNHDARFNGRLVSTFDKNFNLDNAVIDISVPKITLNMPEEYDDAKTIENIALSGFYDNIDHKFQLDLRSVDVIGAELKGKVSGTFKDTIYKFKAALNSDEMDLGLFTTYWPKSLKSESAATWLTEKITDGEFTDVNAAANIEYDFATEELKHDNAHLDFAFKGMSIDYRAPLIPISNASGSGSIDPDGLQLTVEKGKVADLALSDASVILKDIFVTGAGIANIDLNLKGDIPTVFDYISREPISLGERMDFSPDETKGKANVNVQLSFPTIKDLLASQVEVVVDADLDDLFIPQAVKDHPLTSGPFKLKYDGDKLTLNGTGKLLGRPIKLDWTRYIDEDKYKTYSIINASFQADKTLRDAFNIGLDDYISGTPNVDIVYKEGKSAYSCINVKADITPVVFMVKPFNYTKPAKARGSASANVVLKDGEVQEIKNLNIKTADSAVKNASLKFGKIGNTWDVKTASFTNAKILKNSFDLNVTRISPQMMRFEVDAKYLDLLPFLSFNKANDAAKPDAKDSAELQIEVFAKVAHLNTSKKSGFITNAKSYVLVGADDTVKQLELDATSGDRAVYLRYKPELKSKALEFRLEADNAGAFLRAFDLYDNAVGGKIIVSGHSIKGGHPNDVQGAALIEDFMVINAPSLARLLSAMSLTGMEDLLTADGISFDRLESNLKWTISDNGIRFHFNKGRTSGGALGLTFEGNIHQGKRNEIDINGTIVPISFLNKLVSKIPLLGDILTGGDNQGIFAATYTIKGTSESTKVSINPLSVLAPGILRRILFESDNSDDE
jgi:uncharacterized protein YhdP